MKHLRLGTRGSRLALQQSRIVADRLGERGVTVELVTIVADGDVRAPDAPVGEGIFVTALERALVAGEIDVAVHSAKDLPLDEDPRLTIVAYPERADPRDALVTRGPATSLADLLSGATVGTDSPRRGGFLRSLRPDLDVISLYGNVDTRLQRLDSGQADALVLAAAGLDRLGIGSRAVERLDPDAMPPAPGQGALAVQVRRGDADVTAVVAPLDDADVRRAVVAERALLKAMGGGCRAPVGALATSNHTHITLLAGAVSADGRTRKIVTRSMAHDGRALAKGACEAADDLNLSVPLNSRALLDTRPELDPELVLAVNRMGFEHVHVPAIEIGDGGADELDRARASLASYDWVVLTSRRGVEALLRDGAPRAGSHVRWAAVGTGTASALRKHGVEAVCVPPSANAEAIPAAMAGVASVQGARVLLARADAAGPSLPAQLRRMGATVDDVVAYRTAQAPQASKGSMLEILADPRLEAVVFASGSAVRGLVGLAGDAVDVARSLKVFTIGPRTSAVARELGFKVAGEAATRDSSGLAGAIKQALDDEVERWVESQLAPL